MSRSPKRLSLALAVALVTAAPAQDVSTLKTYGRDSMPVFPPDQLVRGADGALYGMNHYAICRWEPDGSGFTILRQLPVDPATQLVFGGRPALSGNTLYGAANTNLGTLGHGQTVFRINTDGSGYSVIKADIPIRRWLSGLTHEPPGIVRSGDTLYGWGFKINIDGSGFTELDGFDQWDGWPYWHLEILVSGDKIYGSTDGGGKYGAGTVFRMNTDGTGYTVLVDFTTNETSGINPYLTLVGDTLYGLSFGSKAKVFKVNVDGTGYRVLKDDFAANGEGLRRRRLEHSMGVLYGTSASAAGDAMRWSFFKMNTDGTGYTELMPLDAKVEPAPETWPGVGIVAVVDDTLYGVARSPRGFEGGGGALAGKSGALFKMNTDGSGFTVLHGFAEYVPFPDGRAPNLLTVADGVLYGSDYSSDGNSRVFRMNTDGTGFTPLVSESVMGVRLTVSGSNLFGVLVGRPLGDGEFSNARVFRVNTDGTDLTILKEFLRSVDGIGAKPSAGLALSGNTLYGTIDASSGSNGLPADSGRVFKLQTDGSGYEVLYTLRLDITTWASSDGNFGARSSELTVEGQTLYGTAFGGGEFGSGTVFKLNTDGSGFAVLKHFSPMMGNPGERLTLSGDTLYGTVSLGPDGPGGGLFRVNIDGSGFMLIKQFPDAVWDNGRGRFLNGDGANPLLGLTVSGNTLYGTTLQGGQFGNGTLFKLNTDGSGFTVLQHLERTSPAWSTYGPGLAGLVLSENTLYGSAPEGGNEGVGAIYRFGLTPTPSIARLSGGSVEVSWPMAWGEVVLQQNKSSLDPSTWTDVTDPIQDNGMTSRAVFPVDPGSEFFRLIRP